MSETPASALPSDDSSLESAETIAPRSLDGTARPVTPGSQAAEGTYRAQPVSFVRRGTRLLAAALVVEIGSGLGDAVVHAAKENPDMDFLAVEVYTPGLAQTIQKIVSNELGNVRVVQANAPEVLASMLPAGSVSQVWVFFPDPWHKTKHNKRRMVKDTFAPLVARVLEEDGLWRLATDWSTYAEQMRDVGAVSTEFANVHDGERTGTDSPLTEARLSGVDCEQSNELDEIGGWAPRFDGRILTSFENKAHKAGRVIFDLTFRRL